MEDKGLRSVLLRSVSSLALLDKPWQSFMTMVLLLQQLTAGSPTAVLPGQTL